MVMNKIVAPNGRTRKHYLPQAAGSVGAMLRLKPAQEPKQHMSVELDATLIAMASAACGPARPGLAMAATDQTMPSWASCWLIFAASLS